MPAKNHQADARTFGPLVDEAAGRKRGLITQDEAEVLRKAAGLRNDIVHGHLQPKAPSQSYSPKDAMEMVKAIHEAISDLYSRAASG